MRLILDRLKASKNKASSRGNYLQIWRKFNQFVIRLDVKPDRWEWRVALFCAYLVENGYKSATVKSYVSAIKSILACDGYAWDGELLLLDAITKAC